MRDRLAPALEKIGCDMKKRAGRTKRGIQGGSEGSKANKK
jgi:hypothetical protein